jgi:putative ABC transport system ATP-binding protein
MRAVTRSRPEQAAAAVAAVDLVKVYGSGDAAVRASDRVSAAFSGAAQIADALEARR